MLIRNYRRNPVQELTKRLGKLKIISRENLGTKPTRFSLQRYVIYKMKIMGIITPTNIRNMKF